MRRTKIVCTIGPASESREKVQALLAAGMDVARLNFSHGTHEEHGRRIVILKEEAAKIGKHLGIILDTKGPEVRTGRVPEEGITLENGSVFSLDTDLSLGNQQRVGITYTDLWRKVKLGSHILIDDGQLDLEVTSVDSKIIRTVIRNGGVLKSQKGVNVPSALIDLPTVTERDIEDIRFGISQGIDFIAASFTRKAINVLDVRRIVEEMDADVHIIAKIESQEGLNNLDSILEVADGLMVARGDLGVEIPVEEVPIRQKEMIRKCNLLGKPVIVATQMLDSMIRQPRPTRAEASDIANAILDGTDAIMLSGETASGKYPLESVQTMARIAEKTESAWPMVMDWHKNRMTNEISVTDAISHAVCQSADDLKADAIITATSSGSTARMVAKYRPQARIIAVTPNETIANQLCLVWGITPLVVPNMPDTDSMVSEAVGTALDAECISNGDLIILTGGVPVGVSGSTNMMQIVTVGDILVQGVCIGECNVVGRAVVAFSPEEADEKMHQGDILITKSVDGGYLAAIKKASALVTEEGGLSSSGAIFGLNLDILVM